MVPVERSCASLNPGIDEIHLGKKTRFCCRVIFKRRQQECQVK